MYNEKVMKYFLNPKNVGIIENADGEGMVGNITCGDVMYLYITVEKNKKGIEYLKDIKFRTLGCAAAIATSSIVTEMMMGKTVDEALNVKNGDIVNELGGLPPIKVHCSLLAADAMRMAIYDFFKNQKREIPDWLEQEHQRIESESKSTEAHSHELHVEE